MRRFLYLKAALMLLLVVAATGLVLPSLMAEDWLPETYSTDWVKDANGNPKVYKVRDRAPKFKLGLDLQGGLHLEYSVAVDEALEHQLDRIAAELEAGFRDKKETEVKVEREGIDTLYIKFEDPEQVAVATDDVMGVTFGVLERVEADDPDVPSEDEGVITLKMPEEIINENRNAAVGNALETVRKRVDAMGVAEPNIYPKNRQIVVELPGLSDTTTEAKAASKVAGDRLREILEGAGAQQVVLGEVRGDPWALKVTVPGRNLREFLGTVFEGTITEEDIIADKRLKTELQILEADADVNADETSEIIGLSEIAREQVLEESSDFRRLLKVIERQAVLTMHLVDDETPFRETGSPYLRALYEADLVREGMGISVNMEGDYGREGGVTVKEPFAFYAKETEILDRFFNNLPPEWRLPPELKVIYGPVPWKTRRGSGVEPEILYKTYVVKARAEVTGEHIVNASVGFDNDNGQPVVNVKLDRIGAGLFEEMSGSNVGRKMAIVLDELVRSDPIFNERIGGGSVRITLGATPGQTVREAANDLTKVLKSGSLPARLQKEFEIRVGADLGRDSVERGFKAFVYGLLAVIVFMLIYYRGSGVIAVFALVFNMVLILAAMAFFGATLTLPGIAGIVLTIGMAVDANVIIFERVREYIREGFTARAAIESGYDRAFTTILDAQLTTAIAGLVLYQYGSGPIQGFAVTLMIGIATSIFTGVFCSRIFFDFQANRRGYNRVSI